MPRRFQNEDFQWANADNDSQSGSVRCFKLIIDVLFRIDHGSFAAITEEVRCMHEPFDVEAFFKHGVAVQIS